MTWTPARAEAGVRVIKHSEGGVVRRVVLLDECGGEVVLVNQFLTHLADSGSQPEHCVAYAYDLRHLVGFLRARPGLGWVPPGDGVGVLGVPASVPAPPGATSGSDGRHSSRDGCCRRRRCNGRWRRRRASSSGRSRRGVFTAENPMQQRYDAALARVPTRHRPFVGRAVASSQFVARFGCGCRCGCLARCRARCRGLVGLMSTLRDLAVFLLMLDGGLRPAEVLLLHLDDISYGRRRVTIANAMTTPRGAREVTTGTGRGFAPAADVGRGEPLRAA